LFAADLRSQSWRLLVSTIQQGPNGVASEVVFGSADQSPTVAHTSQATTLTLEAFLWINRKSKSLSNFMEPQLVTMMLQSSVGQQINFQFVVQPQPEEPCVRNEPAMWCWCQQDFVANGNIRCFSQLLNQDSPSCEATSLTLKWFGSDNKSVIEFPHQIQDYFLRHVPIVDDETTVMLTPQSRRTYDMGITFPSPATREFWSFSMRASRDGQNSKTISSGQIRISNCDARPPLFEFVNDDLSDLVIGLYQTEYISVRLKNRDMRSCYSQFDLSLQLDPHTAWDVDGLGTVTVVYLRESIVEIALTPLRSASIDRMYNTALTLNPYGLTLPLNITVFNSNCRPAPPTVHIWPCDDVVHLPGVEGETAFCGNATSNDLGE
jgi:hypothetical protein